MLITSITDRIGRQKVLLSIDHNHFNFRKKTHTPRTNISSGDVSSVPPFWKFPCILSLDKWLLRLML